MASDDKQIRDTPHYHPLVRSVARSLRSHCEVPAKAHVLIAISGGADSVALARALALLAPRRHFALKLTLGHINHKLRGAASEGDAAFVQQLADTLGLPCHTATLDLSNEKGNLEANARRERYRELGIMAQQCGATAIATAHHADDQLETVLMRLLRGTSARGLRGIAWRRRLKSDDSSLRIAVIRPMLGVERVRVLNFLSKLNQTHREDATNADTARMRNRLRHEVIPLIKAIKSDAPKRAVALGQHMGDIDKLIGQHVNEACNEIKDDSKIDRDKARKLNPIVLTQLLRRQLIRAGVGADKLPGHALHQVVEAIRDQTGGTRTFEFAGNTKIEVRAQTVRLV